MRSPRHVNHDNLLKGNLWVEVAASPLFFCLETPGQDQATTRQAAKLNAKIKAYKLNVKN